MQDMLTRAVDSLLDRFHSTAGLAEGVQPADQWERFVEIGLTAAELPEACGGSALPFSDIAPVYETLGRRLSEAGLIEFSVMGGGLLAACHATTGRALLPAIADGSARVVLAFDEPGAAGEIGFTRTQARPSEGGWSLNGLKSVVRGGEKATHALIPAMIGDDLALFVVPCDAPGLTRIAYQLYDGSGAADFALDAVHVGPAQRIAVGTEARELIESALDRGRAALCNVALGMMQAVHDMTLAYVKTRRQFDQPIGSFQTMQHRMADMHMDLELARSAAQLATEAVSVERTEPERMQMVSAAMVTMATSMRAIGQSAIQAHGGIGMTREYLLGHYVQRLTLFERYLGTADDHLDRYMQF